MNVPVPGPETSVTPNGDFPPLISPVITAEAVAGGATHLSVCVTEAKTASSGSITIASVSSVQPLPSVTVIT
ncbi:hypothetical protein D3C72_401610 [compost metagenome]